MYREPGHQNFLMNVHVTPTPLERPMAAARYWQTALCPLGVLEEPVIEKGLQTEICNPLIMLVRPAGFEPTTPWFVARYSIHLSYGRL